jgi:capsular exopolysaccharide synthesis family protein
MSQNLAVHNDHEDGRRSAHEGASDSQPSGGDFERGYPTEGRLDPTQFIIVFLSHWRLFAGILAGSLAIAIAATVLTEPKFTATSTVVLESAPTTRDAAPTPVDTATVDTEVEVVRSRALALMVAAAYAQRTKQPVEAVLPEVEGGLAVSRSGLTSAITIAVTSTDKNRASEIANLFAEQYLVLQTETKATAGRTSGEFVSTRLAALRADVEKANAAISSYKAAHGLQAMPGANYTEGEVSSYNQQLAGARAALAEDEARLSLARSQLSRGASSSGETFDSQLLRQLRARRGELSGRAAQQVDRYGEQHPDLIKSRAEIADLDSQIQAELSRVIAGLEAQTQVARRRVGSLQSSLGTARGTLASGDAASLELAELERTAEAARTVYADFLNRSKQISADAGGERADARILSAAQPPGAPSSPNVPMNIGLGLIFGLVGGAAGVLVAERLQLALTTGRDVETKLGLPYLGGLPALGSVVEAKYRHMTPAQYVMEKPLSSFSEAVRSLRTALRTVRDGRPAKVVVFTSSLPSEGKSNSAVCVGRSAAQGGAKVLIIDCDLRRRNVNNLLGINPERGLLEVLTGRATMQDVIVTDTASGMDVLPLASSSFTPEDVFDTAAMNELLREASSKYDLVILDTAPVLAVSDTRILAAKADAVVFLAKWRQTPVNAIEAAIKLLEASGAYVGGVVLSQVDMKRQVRYGYGDQTYYYAKYRKYYQDDSGR